MQVYECVGVTGKYYKGVMAMPNKNEKEVKQEKEEKVVDETKKDEVVDEKKDEKPIDEKVDNKETEQKEVIEEKKEETETKEDEAEEKEAPVVEQEVESHDAIRIEDLMTKEEFNARMAAFEAKYDAAMKEVADLKEQNAQLLDGKNKAEAEKEDLKNKYERADFGNIPSKNLGGASQNPERYQSFDEYSKQFM